MPSRYQRGDARRGAVSTGTAPTRMLGDGSNLAAEQLAEEAVARRGTIACHHVHQLVIHQVRHALARRERLEGEAHGARCAV